ncbi:MAG TPA: hypothetical protein VGN34_14335 [Ktedonobacteraceae bacterium]
MIWIILHPKMTAEHLGFIPSFLSEDDKRPAKEQINDRYVAGWNKFDGFTKDSNHVLKYPDDPSMHPLAATKLRDELILFYEHSWLVIVQPDGSWEAARVD